jgi:hypothetical protein
MTTETNSRTLGSRVDRAQVRRYQLRFQHHRDAAISPKELAAFEALTSTQIDLLMQGVPPARAGFLGWVFSSMLGYVATGATNFRMGCSALVITSAGYVGRHPSRPTEIGVTPPR